MIEAALPFPAIDPVLLRLGPVQLHWYAMAYVAGLVLAWWGIVRTLRRQRLWATPPFNGAPPATEDDIGDLVAWATLGVIVGGRLGWDLFYGIILCSVTPDAGGTCNGLPGDFLVRPWRLIAEWNGLVPQLRDPAGPGKPFALSQHPRPAYGAPTHMGYALRDDRFRYVEWRELATGAVAARELYDHRTDPRETVNGAADPVHREAMDKLAAQLRTVAPAARR